MRPVSLLRANLGWRCTTPHVRRPTTAALLIGISQLVTASIIASADRSSLWLAAAELIQLYGSRSTLSGRDEEVPACSATIVRLILTASDMRWRNENLLDATRASRRRRRHGCINVDLLASMASLPVSIGCSLVSLA